MYYVYANPTYMAANKLICILYVCIHSSKPVKHATIVRHQIGREQASKCVHRHVTAAKHQECDAVLSANGRQRALQRTIVRRPRGAMLVRKVRELDVLRLRSVRIEVVAAPIGVHVHGDPVFPLDRRRGCCTRSSSSTCRRYPADSLWQRRRTGGTSAGRATAGAISRPSASSSVVEDDVAILVDLEHRLGFAVDDHVHGLRE